MSFPDPDDSAWLPYPPRSCLAAVCDVVASCWCCGAEARLFGVVDFQKNCAGRTDGRFALSGVPVYYHRCSRCEFLFSTFFDSFSDEDFRSHIYNEDYSLIDPEFEVDRPHRLAADVVHLFPTQRPRRVLDYGSGSGQMAARLREVGFSEVVSFDPFMPGFTTRPEGSFDLILCVEVFEHVRDPIQVLTDLVSLLDDSGLILIATLLQPAEIARQGVAWWYLAPRNGHVALHSRSSLAFLAARLGLQGGSFNEGLHALFRVPPRFAWHLLTTDPPPGP